MRNIEQTIIELSDVYPEKFFINEIVYDVLEYLKTYVKEDDEDKNMLYTLLSNKEE